MVTVALDKTGTLTQGRPQLLRCVPLSGVSERDALQMAAAVQSGSEHPLARAVLQAAQAQALSWPTPQQVQAVAQRYFGDEQLTVGTLLPQAPQPGAARAAPRAAPAGMRH